MARSSSGPLIPPAPRPGSEIHVNCIARALTTVALIAPLGVPTPSYHAAGCSAAPDSIESEWHRRGAWRRLSPYPTAREAAPTDSIGVWLERWTLENGNVQLRHVRANETSVVTLSPDRCRASSTVHRRSFESGDSANQFTDADLSKLLRATDSGMIYIWSPRMPLSIRGLGEARGAARRLGISLTALAADALPSEVHGARVPADGKRLVESLELMYRGATLHYPTVLFFKHSALAGLAIPGYKEHTTYEQLYRETLVGEPASKHVATRVPRLWIDRTARIDTLRSFETTRPLNSFFKPVGASHLVTYTSQAAPYLVNLDTRVEMPIPGNQRDPAATPDGRFITISGLFFYPTERLVAGDTMAFFADSSFPATINQCRCWRKARKAARTGLLVDQTSPPRSCRG
jgi:hypothetical protein